jgi:O-acetyl-ADP-ribose deacetylase (regulator of RNase III)
MPDKTCFVIMPFGEKQDADGKAIDFDEIYEYLIKPAVGEITPDCVRCDQIGEAGWIHAKMIDRVYEADIAIVDITSLNPNVFYELGVRHALRSSVTVLIRRKGTRLPFNIEGLNVIEYDLGPKDVAEAKASIAKLIRSGLSRAATDSLVHEVLDLRIGTAPQPAAKSETRYVVDAAPAKRLCVIAGDIKNIKGIDVWVNSENTNMQMARFFDRSVSSLIRHLGAEKDVTGHVTKDVIADALTAAMGSHKTVDPATVIVTSSGRLADTHQVKWVFHAAAVAGAPGKGYQPIHDVADCVTNALERADELSGDGDRLSSILFPLLGTGTAGGDLKSIVGSLLDAAIDYLTGRPGSAVDRVCFVGWSEAEVLACQSVLEKLPVTVEAAGSAP